jgi:hypothetical protein
MSAKQQQESRKFNGDGVVEFETFREDLLIEADKRGCRQHLQWNADEVREDQSVPEEVFPFERQCIPGQEEALALIQKQDKIARLEAKYIEQVELVRGGFAGAKRLEEETKLLIMKQNEIVNLENGFDKAVNDLKSACDLYDKRLKLFQDQRAAAVHLLKNWLGQNPLNQIYLVLKDVGPKNAMKKLADSYDCEAQTAQYYNSVSKKVTALIFSNSVGKVVDHMALLDKWNAALVRMGKGYTDDQLLHYMLDAIRRGNEKVNKLYRRAVEHIFMNDSKRKDAIDLLIRVEHAKGADAELTGERQNSAGAMFVRSKEFAGTATAEKDKKRGSKRRGDHGSGDGGKKSKGGEQKPAAAKVPPECSRCGSTEHFRKDCEAEVFCKPCNVDTHAEKACWKTHPEKMPHFFKKVGKKN